MPLAAASADSPMATRIPLMAKTAVQALCTSATSRLAPVSIRISFAFILDLRATPRRSLAVRAQTG
jgi:hypothetical protein